MWMSNFTVPSPRNSVAAIGKILDARYWPFIVSLIFSGLSRGAPRMFSLSLILRYSHLVSEVGLGLSRHRRQLRLFHNDRCRGSARNRASGDEFCSHSRIRIERGQSRFTLLQPVSGAYDRATWPQLPNNGASCAITIGRAIFRGRNIFVLAPGREFVGGDRLGEIDRRPGLLRNTSGKLPALETDDPAHVTPPRCHYRTPATTRISSRLQRFALLVAGGESKMLFLLRKKKFVAARTQPRRWAARSGTEKR
jgi:hypothetical protein